MRFHVEDMSCGSCVRHINEAIARVDADATIEADTVSRTITVTTNAAQHTIERALADEGYPATAI